jgi:hypothetical protein
LSSGFFLNGLSGPRDSETAALVRLCTNSAVQETPLHSACHEDDLTGHVA